MTPLQAAKQRAKRRKPSPLSMPATSRLADYPELLALVPDRPGPVDTCPFRVAKLTVLPGRRVVRQRVFTGEPEVNA